MTGQRALQSFDELGTVIKRELRTLALLDKPVTYGYPPAHVAQLEAVIVAALLDGWGQLDDVDGLEPEDFSDRLLAHLFAFTRAARNEGRSYSDISVSTAFERLGLCSAEAMRAELKRLRLDVVGRHGEPLREAARQIVKVARLRRALAAIARLDADVRYAAQVGEHIDVDAVLHSIELATGEAK